MSVLPSPSLLWSESFLPLFFKLDKLECGKHGLRCWIFVDQSNPFAVSRDPFWYWFWYKYHKMKLQTMLLPSHIKTNMLHNSTWTTSHTPVFLMDPFNHFSSKLWKRSSQPELMFDSMRIMVDWQYKQFRDKIDYLFNV